MAKGLNFQLTPNKDFIALANQRYQELLSQDYKEDRKKKTLWEENPEYRDAVLKLIDRSFNMALRALEDFQVQKEKISPDSKKEDSI